MSYIHTAISSDIIIALPFSFSATWVDIRGTYYKPGAVVIVHSNLMPQFGLIDEILVIDVEIYFFVYRLFVTDCFNHYFHSYEVSWTIPPLFNVYMQTDLADHHVLHQYKLSSSPSISFIPLKYHIIENT